MVSSSRWWSSIASATCPNIPSISGQTAPDQSHGPTMSLRRRGSSLSSQKSRVQPRRLRWSNPCRLFGACHSVTSPDRGADRRECQSNRPRVGLGSRPVDRGLQCSDQRRSCLTASGGLFSYNLVPEEAERLEITAIDGDGNVSDHFKAYSGVTSSLWDSPMMTASGSYERRHDPGPPGQIGSRSSGSLTSGLLSNPTPPPMVCRCGLARAGLRPGPGGSRRCLDVLPRPDLDPRNPNAVVQRLPRLLLRRLRLLDRHRADRPLYGQLPVLELVELLSANAVLTLDYMSLWTDLNLYVNAAELGPAGQHRDRARRRRQWTSTGSGFLATYSVSSISLLLGIFEPLLEALLPHHWGHGTRCGRGRALRHRDRDGDGPHGHELGRRSAARLYPV